MCRVVLGYAKIDAAVGGVGVEAFSLPVIAGQRDIQSAIDGVTLDFAGEPVDRHAAIGGFESVHRR
jgi:hypothetical protein